MNMFISYFLGQQPTTHSPMCLVCKITSQRMLSNTRHPPSDAISSHKAQNNIPVSPAEGTVSKLKVPRTENGNLLSEERFALFAGDYEEPFICILVPYQI